MQEGQYLMKKASNCLINVFFFPLIFISFLGSVSVLCNQFIHLPSQGVILLDFSILLSCFGYVLLQKKGFVNFVIKIAQSDNFRKAIFLLIIFWQIYMILSISGFSVWDPGIIIKRAMRSNYGVSNYFSLYPNTISLLYFEHFIWLILGHPSIKVLTIVLNIINMVLMDSAVFLLTKKISQNYFLRPIYYLISLLFIILLIISPWICLPYSDVASFAFSAYLLLTFWKISKETNWKLYLFTGFILFIDYTLKPSTIIPLIAFIIIEIVFNSKKENWRRTRVKCLALLLLIFIILLGGANIVKANNHLVSVDKQRSFGMAHYIAMGINGSGGYNLDDVTRDTNIKKRSERNSTDLNIWKARLKKRGFTGYETFLIGKQIKNTSDGSFGWGKEGIFLQSFKSDFSIPQFLYMNKQGIAQEYNQSVSWIFQLGWIVILFGMFFVLHLDSFRIQFLKYTVVGFWVFLLIFEGGRSRYLIQMLPYIFILSGFGLNCFCKFVNERVSNTNKMSLFDKKY